MYIIRIYKCLKVFKIKQHELEAITNLFSLALYAYLNVLSRSCFPKNKINIFCIAAAVVFSYKFK